MKSLTLNELDEYLVARIRQEAERHGITEEQAALNLLSKGAELDEELGDQATPNGKIGNALDDFVGTMSHEEAEEINNAIKELRMVDKSIWR